MKPLAIVAGLFLLLLANSISAQPSHALTFENFKETEAPLNYFNGGFGSRGTGPGPQLGITFNTPAVVVTAPIGKVLTTASGEAIILNVPIGFSNSLAVNYVTVLNTGSIRICNALNCDGQFLAAINLPAGSNASQTIVFSGVARAAMLSGNGNQIGFKSITLAPQVPPSITTSALPNGFVGVFYTSPPMAASGGQPPYLWSATNLPAGFQINESTGVISGNPTIVRTYGNIDVKVTDSTFPPQTSTKRFSLTFGPPPNPPRVTSFSPTNASEGSGNLELVFNGTDFTSDAQVRWLANGAETGLQTTVQGTTVIRAIVPAALLTQSGTALIYVAQPTGNSAQFTFSILARTRVTITSTPPGRTVLVDGESIVTPRTFDWLTGSQHNLDVPAAQAVGPYSRYAFLRWSQGGARTQAITAAQPVTYTAAFSVQHQLLTPVSPSFGGSVVADPASADGFYDEGTRVSLRAVAAVGFRFAGFSREPAVVSMAAPQNLGALFTMTADQPARILTNVPAAGIHFEAGRRQQVLTLTSPNGATAAFTAAIRYPDGASPRWVNLPVQSGSTPASLSLGVLPDAANLAPGRYQASLIVSSPELADLTVPLQFEIRPTVPASLEVDVRDLRFVSSGEARQSAIVIRTPNPANLPFEVAYETSSSGGSSWLSGTTTSLSASESAPAVIQVSVEPAGLSPGVYNGKILVKPRNQPEIGIPVALVVTAAPLVRPVESAVYWRVDRDRRGTLSRTLDYNVSAGVSWTAWTSQPWLRVAPLSPTTLQVDVDLDQIEEGVNRGSISVQADGPNPGPEVIVPVEVAVMPSGYPAVSARPQAVAFAGPSLSATRTVIFEPSRSGPVTVRASQPWLAIETRELDSRTFEISLRVLAEALLLGPGSHRAFVAIQDAAGAGTSVAVLVQVPSSPCSPSRLIPLVTSTPPSFDLDGLAPAPLEVQLIDDCGALATSGVVAAVTSSREPQIQLMATGDGRWKGTWTSTLNAGTVSLQVLAADPVRGIGVAGQAEPTVSAAIVSASSRPVLQGEQPIETEAGVKLTSITPGMRFRIRGQGLSTPDAWPEVLLGGRSLAVVDARSTQITVEAPPDLLSDSLQDLIVRLGGAASIPEPVVVGSRRPN